MKFNAQLTAALAGMAIASVSVITLTQTVTALPASEVSTIAKDLTIMVDGQNPGSGVLIAKQGKTYFVLTAAHVVGTEDEYIIVAPDGNRYPLNYKTVKKLPGVDLAVLQFTSNENYSVARLADFNQVTEGTQVYTAGFANPGQGTNERIYRFTIGEISGRLPNPKEGYALLYTNITRVGFSGGPVLDANGFLVGIHGRGEGEADQTSGNESGTTVMNKTGFNLGIPIKTFLELAPKAGVDLRLRIEKSSLTVQEQFTTPPPTVQGPTVTSPPPPVFPTVPTVVRPSAVPQEEPVCAGRRCI